MSFNHSKKGKTNKKFEYKSKQLSKQAERALALEWSSLNLSLDTDLQIISVEPDPISSKLIVHVSVGEDNQLNEKEIIQILKNEKGYIRSIIAQAINRKKVPELFFKIVPAWSEHEKE